MTSSQVRNLVVDDHPLVISCIREWWSDSRDPKESAELSLLVPKLMIEFFGHTSFLYQDRSDVGAFLVGLHPPRPYDQAYIHFVGVSPRLRGRGIARELYALFIDHARDRGRDDIRAITSPRNSGSIAFHRAMGFALAPGDDLRDGVPVHRDYDGPGQDRVCFRLRLSEREA